jgi:hypothetical protein
LPLEKYEAKIWAWQVNTRELVSEKINVIISVHDMFNIPSPTQETSRDLVEIHR